MGWPKGRKRGPGSPEVREKLRAAQTAAWANPEVREKRRAAQMQARLCRAQQCQACYEGNCLACDGGKCKCICSAEMDRKVIPVQRRA